MDLPYTFFFLGEMAFHDKRPYISLDNKALQRIRNAAAASGCNDLLEEIKNEEIERSSNATRDNTTGLHHMLRLLSDYCMALKQAGIEVPLEICKTTSLISKEVERDYGGIPPFAVGCPMGNFMQEAKKIETFIKNNLGMYCREFPGVYEKLIRYMETGDIN